MPPTTRATSSDSPGLAAAGAVDEDQLPVDRLRPGPRRGQRRRPPPRPRDRTAPRHEPRAGPGPRPEAPRLGGLRPRSLRARHARRRQPRPRRRLRGRRRRHRPSFLAARSRQSLLVRAREPTPGPPSSTSMNSGLSPPELRRTRRRRRRGRPRTSGTPGTPPRLQAQSRQPLLLTMNCLNGYFVAPAFDSLAESLLEGRGPRRHRRLLALRPEPRRARPRLPPGHGQRGRQRPPPEARGRRARRAAGLRRLRATARAPRHLLTSSATPP